MARLNHVKKFRGTSKTEDGNLRCERCGDPIKPGDSYRWWANKLPQSSYAQRHNRCMKSSCTPRASDMTPGRRGQLYAIQETVEDALASFEGTESSDLLEIWQSASDELQSLADDIRESAQNMEEGFGHATYQSEELEQKAEDIEQIAQDEPDFEEAPAKEDIEIDERPDATDEENEAERESKHDEAMQEWASTEGEKITEKLYEVEV